MAARARLLFMAEGFPVSSPNRVATRWTGAELSTGKSIPLVGAAGASGPGRRPKRRGCRRRGVADNVGLSDLGPLPSPIRLGAGGTSGAAHADARGLTGDRARR